MASPTARYRSEYRERHVPAGYMGWVHLFATTTVCVGIITWAVLLLDDVHPLEWLTLPIAFAIANLAEYLGHRHPMHRAMGPLKKMCLRHAGQHHRSFTHRAMCADDHRDFHIVLFPVLLLGFFMGGIALPLTLAAFFLFSVNVGALFAIVAAGYLATYEWLHLSYHLPEDSFLGRLPFMPQLRRHHLVHHDPGVMAKANFNITFPICDVLFGTKARLTTDENAAASPRAESA